VLNAIMAFNPVVLVVAAIVALGAALVVAYQKVDWFRSAVDTARQVLQKVWDVILRVGGAVAGFSLAVITGQFNLVAGAVRTVIGGQIDFEEGVERVLRQILENDDERSL